MICKSCGIEIIAGRRFCQKCGMPAIDHTIRPREEDPEERKTISKRIMELKPVVEAIEEKERKEKEEAEKKRLKELEEAREKAEAEIMRMSEEEEEEILDEDEEEYEESSKEILDGDDPSTVELEKEEILEQEEFDQVPGARSITELVEEAQILSESTVKFYGKVCYLDFEIDSFIFNLEDKDESVSCVVQYSDEDIEYNELLYTREDIESVISGLKRGDSLIVEGIINANENDEVIINVLSIEGSDFYIRCSN